MFDPKQAAKERAEAIRYGDMSKTQREDLQRVTSVRLWGQATADTLFTKNRNGEWCVITPR